MRKKKLDKLINHYMADVEHTEISDNVLNLAKAELNKNIQQTSRKSNFKRNLLIATSCLVMMVMVICTVVFTLPSKGNEKNFYCYESDVDA